MCVSVCAVLCHGCDGCHGITSSRAAVLLCLLIHPSQSSLQTPGFNTWGCAVLPLSAHSNALQSSSLYYAKHRTNLFSLDIVISLKHPPCIHNLNGRPKSHLQRAPPVRSSLDANAALPSHPRSSSQNALQPLPHATKTSFGSGSFALQHPIMDREYD